MWNIKRCGIDSNLNPTPKDACKGIGFFFDNCAGQNKNRMVTRLLLFLVGRNICKLYHATFFSLDTQIMIATTYLKFLNILYRKQNIYNRDKLMEILNAYNNNIYVVFVEEGIFINWDKLKEKFFKRMPSNTTKSNHTFKVNNK